ncbi:MAG: P-loop NTPase [Nitrospirota bacterium]
MSFQKKSSETPGLFDGTSSSKKEIWAIAGGKGGTGKSFIASNLGVALAKMGKSVLLVDADLGCANLHTFLGVQPKVTLSDFVSGKIKAIEDTLTPTNFPNLMLISGACDFLEIANPKHSQKNRLIRQLHQLPFEHIILDLGAGTGFTLLDFFLSADTGILSVLPEPTSIENAYRFIKSAFYRRFKTMTKNKEMKALITSAMNDKNEYGIRTPHDLMDHIASVDEEMGKKMKESVLSFSPRIIVNQVRSRDDMTLGFSMRSACAKYFGIKVDYVGYIEYDDYVWMATKKRTPLILERPYAPAVRCLNQVVSNLISRDELKLDAILRM